MRRVVVGDPTDWPVENTRPVAIIDATVEDLENRWDIQFVSDVDDLGPLRLAVVVVPDATRLDLPPLSFGLVRYEDAPRRGVYVYEPESSAGNLMTFAWLLQLSSDDFAAVFVGGRWLEGSDVARAFAVRKPPMFRRAKRRALGKPSRRD